MWNEAGKGVWSECEILKRQRHCAVQRGANPKGGAVEALGQQQGALQRLQAVPPDREGDGKRTSWKLYQEVSVGNPYLTVSQNWRAVLGAAVSASISRPEASLVTNCLKNVGIVTRDPWSVPVLQYPACMWQAWQASLKDFAR